MLSDNLRSLPYLVHTNRELGLMLIGKKPLAIFSYTEGYEIDFVLRYLKMFDRHVETGRFLKRETVESLRSLNNRSHHRLYYTLPGEQWRVNAMVDLMNTAGKWSNDRERRFGTLLGYEDWQNDFWLNRYPIDGS